MPVPTDITAGTLTITNGSAAVTGGGTSWLASDLRQGDVILWIEGGDGFQTPILADVPASNTALTLVEPWEGPTLTGVRYRIRYQWDSSRVSAQSRQLIELLDNGNILALASLTGPGVPVFDGPHSMTIRPTQDFINGVAYDVQVDTLADRAAYDGQAAGFSVLVSDVGDGRSAVYSKASNTSGDWTAPAYVTGPVGATPDVEATVVSGPTGSTATVDEVPIPGGIRLEFTLPSADGFYNAGVYEIGTAYTTDQVVRHNGSSFISLQAVPAGTSPSSAFPPVDTAFWQVLAARGANGLGTISEIVAGTGIAVDNTDPAAPIVSFDGIAGPEKATIPETIQGTDDEKYVTPLGLSSVIAPLIYTVEKAVGRWNISKYNSRIGVGGSVLGTTSSSIDGGISGRTFAVDTVSKRIKQSGLVRSVRIALNTTTGAYSNSLKIKVLRKAGTGYTLVSESGFLTPTATTSIQSIEISPPIACQQGDVVGFWLKGSSDVLLKSRSSSGELLRYQDGETLPGTWTNISNFDADLELDSIVPFFVVLGDSIIAGSNTPTPWLTIYASGPAGEVSSDPFNSVRNSILNSTYQNLGEPATTWASVAAKLAVVTSLTPYCVVFSFGVNDVAAGRSWSTIEAEMNAAKIALGSSVQIAVCEVLPWTLSNDAQAGAIRSLNANYAAWCSANDAILIQAHDAMGKIRASTGQLDDLKSEYDYDGVHLTLLGVNVLSSLIDNGLRTKAWMN